MLDDNPHKRKPWCPEKDKFLIIDCWANFDFFKMKPEGKEPNQQVPMPVKLFRARLDQLETDPCCGGPRHANSRPSSTRSVDGGSTTACKRMG